MTTTPTSMPTRLILSHSATTWASTMRACCDPSTCRPLSTTQVRRIVDRSGGNSPNGGTSRRKQWDVPYHPNPPQPSRVTLHDCIDEICAADRHGGDVTGSNETTRRTGPSIPDVASGGVDIRLTTYVHVNTYCPIYGHGPKAFS